MSKISLIVMLLLLKMGAGFAQNYFVFIGSDNKQPFYVRVDSEFHASTAGGHLILSQLKDSTYNITIGFPGQALPEQHYAFSISGKDQAFELQKQGQDGLRLYDLQTSEWLTPKGGSVAEETYSPGIKKDDAFSRMMAGVVHDTAVLYNTYAMEQALSDSPAVAKNSSPTGAAPRADTAATSTGSAVAPVTVDSTRPIMTTTRTTPVDQAAAITFMDSTSTTPLYRPAQVTKLSEHRGPRNVRLVYADYSGGKQTDTIVVIIPVDTPASAKTPGRRQHSSDNAGTRTPVRQPHTGDTAAVQAGVHGPNADSPVTSSGTANHPEAPAIPPAESARPHPADSQRRQPKAVPFVNSDCHDFATDFDVDKLRARMLQASRDDERVTLARKTFKVKCFSTRQIRTLSDVFTSDAGKFHFFEAAWPFAADDHFHELSDLLADPVYHNKFKTMTHMQ